MAHPNEWSADHLADRRRLRRRLTWWRVLAAVAVLTAIGAVSWRAAGVSPGAAHIARISIDGVITGDEATLKMIGDIGRSQAKAAIVTIESPGGTTTGAERLYDSIRKLREKMPVVAVVRGMAASGGYIAALGADRIVAQGNSLVGSIGVLFQFPNVGKLMDTVGVSLEEVKSSPLKAAPNGMGPTSPEARAALQAIVDDSYAWFRDLVKERRGMNDTELAVIADGRVFTGRQSVRLKLIDQIGAEPDAIAWLEKDKNVTKDLPVRRWRTERERGKVGILGFASGAAEAFGLPNVAEWAQKIATSVRYQPLDGLLSIWQARVVD